MPSKVACVAALFFFTSIIALAQGDVPERTIGAANGRMWAAMNDASRLYYVMGLGDGVQIFASVEDAEKFRCRCTNGEIIEGITNLYAADPVNANVPILVMLRLHVARAKGATKAEVEKEITDFLKTLSQNRPVTTPPSN